MSESGHDLHRHIQDGLFGFCPTCFHEVAERERRLGGNDRCVLGHVFPSRLAVRLGDLRLSAVKTTVKDEQGK